MRPSNAKVQNHNENADRHLIACALRWRSFYTPGDFTVTHYLSKGAIPPHLPESNEQNLVVIEAFLEAAKRYARGGYDVIVDGIVGPWFLEPWRALVREDYEVHYIVLRASKEETMKRAVERSKLDRKTNVELVETMWEQFCNLGIYESNVIETTTYSIQEAVFAVKEKISSGAALLS